MPVCGAGQPRRLAQANNMAALHRRLTQALAVHVAGMVGCQNMHRTSLCTIALQDDTAARATPGKGELSAREASVTYLQCLGSMRPEEGLPRAEARS